MQAFLCEHCPLAFEIGSYVYWDLNGDTDRLVCTHCGTMHWLEFMVASDSRTPDAVAMSGATTFRALPHPVRSVSKVKIASEDGQDFFDYEWPYGSDDWIEIARWPDRKPIDSLACHHCRYDGGLISLEHPRNRDDCWPVFRNTEGEEHCPLCKTRMLLLYDVTIN